jgi:hypothetical protein
VLRPWTAADAQWLNRLHRERELEPGEEPPGLEDTQRNVTRKVEQVAATGISVLPVVRKADGLAIGYCGLIEGRSSIDEPEIAYELFRGTTDCGRPSERGTPPRFVSQETSRQAPTRAFPGPSTSSPAILWFGGRAWFSRAR